MKHLLPMHDVNTAQEAIKTILEYIGEDPTREGLIDTPKRVVKSW